MCACCLIRTQGRTQRCVCDHYAKTLLRRWANETPVPIPTISILLSQHYPLTLPHLPPFPISFLFPISTATVPPSVISTVTVSLLPPPRSPLRHLHHLPSTISTPTLLSTLPHLRHRNCVLSVISTATAPALSNATAHRHLLSPLSTASIHSTT